MATIPWPFISQFNLVKFFKKAYSVLTFITVYASITFSNLS